MVKKITKVLILPAFLLLVDSIFAQGLPPPPTPITPIDGGVVILLAAGAAYAVKKLREED